MNTRAKKQSNRSRIIKHIFRNAPVSRATISEETEITPAAVTTNVAALIEEGIIYDLGEVEQSDENTVGRKRILIDLNSSFAYSIGVEFTQKTFALCLTNLRGDIVEQIIIKPTLSQISNITDEIIKYIRQLITQYPSTNIVGIGIAIPGHLNEATNKLVTNSPLWKTFDANRIRKELNLPVICENNVRAMAYGKYLFNPKNTPEDFAFFHIGLGMHCASIINGDLFIGNNYIAGEIGHTIVNPKGRRCECGKYGCLQTFSSESWLIKTCKFLYSGSAPTILKSLVENEDQLTITHITDAYSLGDPLVSSYISDALMYLGVTISNIAIIMNPEKIFLHGQMFTNEDVLKELTDYIQRQLLFVDSTYSDNIEILPYHGMDGAIGASALSINEFFIN